MSHANWTTRVLIEPTLAGDPAADDGSDGTAVQVAPAPGGAARSLVGSRVGGYLITKRLGAGGVGEVFKGVDVILKREVAIKVLRPELAADPQFLARFRQEAQMLARISHPNVASVHAFLHEGETQFMVMEYVPGVSLDEFVRSGGPVPIERALGIFRRALDGIAHAHRCGIVHRDIKPANIMLAESGEVKVMDFGIARALDCDDRLTRAGQVAGTAKAMSPEQIRGEQGDVRSDIYSLGIVLYTLLAGRAPFDGSDLTLMKSQLKEPPPPLRALLPDVPPGVEAAVMRALEKNPMDRFQNAEAFARALDACRAEPEPAAAPAPDWLDAPTATIVNPEPRAFRAAAGAGWRRRFGARFGSAMRRARAALPKPPRIDRRVAGVALALAALVAGGVYEWPRLARHAVPIAASLQTLAALPARLASAVLPAPIEPAAPPAQAQALPPSQPAALPVPESTPLAVAQPTLAPLPPVERPAPATLAIVRLAADGASGDAPSAQRFAPGERVRLLVKPDRDANVYCYLQDESRRILRFYPNRFNPSALVKAAAPLQIPGSMRFELVANRRKVTETVACFASERDVMGELPAAVVGTDFEPIAATSLDEVKDAFARVAAAGSLAQASFEVRVR